MLEVGWSEILVIALILIIVVGPKELPGMLRTFGKMATRLRGMANEFKGQFDEALREAELDDVRKGLNEVNKLNPANSLRDAINPLRQLGQDIKSDLQKATDVSVKPDALVAKPEDKIPDATTQLQPSEPVKPAEAAPAASAPVGAVKEGAASESAITEAGKIKPGIAVAPAITPAVGSDTSKESQDAVAVKKPVTRKKASAAMSVEAPAQTTAAIAAPATAASAKAVPAKASSKVRATSKPVEIAAGEAKKPAPRKKAAKAGEA